ncbi:Dna[CI] antecedent, DciA family protein [Candidatus Erwinia haradaeae]|uniref:Dna[CI] antecedent, DciA family protein n=1 Tax=Candidatus Erwinia haradaeae TaxID=1922217 RepID=A0A451DD18_9GAMM|nr:DciA family protein [Candidatus Erwinia haradaeae]VFP84318.1 Dna[CI] antecedent, DciA family protein [Candidatus Erwinia haradaeae]
MRHGRPHLINDFFNQVQKKSVLQHVYKHATMLIQVNYVLHEMLPETIRPFCSAANFRQGTLVIETAHANSLMFLRCEQSNLLAAVQENILPSLREIDIRINPVMASKIGVQCGQVTSSFHADITHIPLRLLSQESANNLRIVASQSSNKLKYTLERLASCASGRKKIHPS